MGVLMWEMFTGFRAHQGRTAGNIIFLVTSGKGKLELPDAPQRYRVSCVLSDLSPMSQCSETLSANHVQDLVSSCMEMDPNARPTFAEICDMIDAALAESTLSKSVMAPSTPPTLPR